MRTLLIPAKLDFEVQISHSDSCPKYAQSLFLEKQQGLTTVCF